MRTSCLSLAVSALLLAFGRCEDERDRSGALSFAEHGEVPDDQSDTGAAAMANRSTQGPALDVHNASQVAFDELKHGRYMLELAEELHHTLAARHKRLRRRLAARRARRVEQQKMAKGTKAGSATQHDDALMLVEDEESEALPLAGPDLAPHNKSKSSRARGTSSLLQLRDHVSRSGLLSTDEDEEEIWMPLYGDEILATWSRQLTPRIASASEAYSSLQVWSHVRSPLLETAASFSVDSGAAVTARDDLALLDLGTGEAAVGGDTGRLRRVASFSRELADRWQSAFVQSFWTVSSAEVFDKTLIVAVLCGLLYGAQSALQGAMAALAVHLAFAVPFGLFASQIVPLSTLHFVTAGLFGLITIFHVNEWFDSSDPRTSKFEDGLEDPAKATPPPSPAAKHRAPSAAESAGFACCFIPVFLAEWGDRTQVVLIALDATLPVLPVVCGAAAALSLLMVLAVFPAAIFGRVKVSEHALGVISSVGLLLCTALAIWSGIKARKAW